MLKGIWNKSQIIQCDKVNKIECSYMMRNSGKCHWKWLHQIQTLLRKKKHRISACHFHFAYNTDIRTHTHTVATQLSEFIILNMTICGVDDNISIN